jgi:hypothetical protein
MKIENADRKAFTKSFKSSSVTAFILTKFSPSDQVDAHENDIRDGKAV